MLRRYIEIVEDIHAGSRIPIDANPHTVEVRTCNVCGKVISGDDVWPAYIEFVFFDEGRYMWGGDICREDKATMTLAVLQSRIVDGEIQR